MTSCLSDRLKLDINGSREKARNEDFVMMIQ